MEPNEPHGNQVGVRELRQNLSVYLARVQKGEALRVTERGRVVAMLVPLPHTATLVESLVAAGRATPARRTLESLGKPPKGPARPLSAVLKALREEERW
jgi:prevent-host-death family protein